jgi:hypothetical protein
LRSGLQGATYAGRIHGGAARLVAPGREGPISSGFP